MTENEAIHSPRTLCLVSSQVFSLLESLPWLMMTMAVFGLGLGSTMGLYNLIMARFMGIENLPPIFGASSLALAVGFITVGPLIGEFPSWLLYSKHFYVTEACVLMEFGSAFLFCTKIFAHLSFSWLSLPLSSQSYAIPALTCICHPQVWFVTSVEATPSVCGSCRVTYSPASSCGCSCRLPRLTTGERQRRRWWWPCDS